MLSKYFSDKWSLASFILLLAFMGLFYQVAWQYPAIDSFPLIERLIDPNYLPNDFFTNTFKEFSPRLVSAKIIVWLSQVLNVEYQYIVAYGNIIRIWLYGVALYLFFLNLAGRSIALIAFAFSALSFLSMPSLPAWWPITYDLTSSNIALIFAMYAWVYALKSNVHISFSLLTLSVLIHPVVGVQALIVSIIIFITNNSWPAFFRLFKTLSLYPFALAFTFAFLYNYLSYQQALPDADFIEINGQFRHGHHFIFTHMHIEKWISSLLMVLLCIAITLFIEKESSTKIKKITLVIIGYSALMITLNYLFAELYPTRFMVSFIPMRSFSILVPIVVLAFSRLAYYQWKNKNYCNFFILFLPFLPYGHVGLTWYLLPNQHELVLSILLILFAMSIIVLHQYRLLSFSLIDKGVERLFQQSVLATYIFPITVIAFLLAVFRFNINIPTLTNSPDIYQWLNHNTAENEILVSELNAANNQKIRLLARRAVVVSKDFPFNELFYKQWYQRYTDLYEHRDSARGRIDSLTEAELNVLMDKYKAHILIRTIPFSDPKMFTLVGESQGDKSLAYIYRNNEVAVNE